MIPPLPAPPAWLNDCAPDSALNARDVRALLRVSKGQFERMLGAGQFPLADYKQTSRYSFGPARHWTVSSVLRALNEAQRTEITV